MCLFKTASRSISYLIAAKALLRLLVFNFTVERLFENGALSIECNRILRFFQKSAAALIYDRGFYYICGQFLLHLRALLHSWSIFIAFEGFSALEVNYYICGFDTSPHPWDQGPVSRKTRRLFGPERKF